MQQTAIVGTRFTDYIIMKFNGLKKNSSDKSLSPTFQIADNDSLNNDVINTTPEPQLNDLVEPDLSEILASIRINPTDELNPPEVAWEQVATFGDNPIMGTLGNISTVIGKAKSRKSFFVNMVVAAVLQGGEFKGFKGCLPSNKRRILYFDTEQGRYHVQLALKRICDQVGDPTPLNLDVYSLRKFRPDQRLALIEHTIENTPNVGFVVIDGIRDLVTSINDEEQATEITSLLMKWSEEKELHIMCVLHQNKNDSNARGHIGTELMNKSETVFSVTVDSTEKHISKVEAEYCRNKSPESFAFEIVDNLPEIAEDYKFNKNTKKQKFDLLSLPDTQKEKILEVAFTNNDEMCYSELVSQIQLSVKSLHSETVGQGKVKTFITYCKNNNLTCQQKERAPYTRNATPKLPF